MITAGTSFCLLWHFPRLTLLSLFDRPRFSPNGPRQLVPAGDAVPGTMYAYLFLFVSFFFCLFVLFLLEWSRPIALGFGICFWRLHVFFLVHV